ncbi:hypothetical protein Tsubulata_012042 [Turnera subulata]|uniref:Uncharacterized protein n=1 Tax=Turnera subulata TaxID=218843 RepID=A0A9Q0GHP3_9ROSI|nr:hypothetical protein Tsubulata_012042 [Turnera subulata]
MKRRVSETSPQHPSPAPAPAPAPFPRGVRSVRSSTTLPDATGSPENHGHSYAAGDAKTSEFAFFKKLKENAAHKICSDSLRQDRSKSNEAELTGCSEERSNIVRNRYQGFRSSSSVKIVMPDTFASFHSSASNECKKSDTRPTLVDIQCLQRNEDENDGTLRPGEAQYCPGELFYNKRQKLRQLVADTSFPEIEDFCAKGYDIVSALLKKLFPYGDEDKCFTAFKGGKVDSRAGADLSAFPESDCDFSKFNWNDEEKWFKALKTREVETDNRFSSRICLESDISPKRSHWRDEDNRFKDWRGVQIGARSKLFAFPESDICSKQLLHMPARNLVEFDGMPSFGIDQPSYRLEIPRERELPDFNSPVCHFHKTYLENGIYEPDCDLSDGNISILCIEGGSSSGFGTENYRSPAFGHRIEQSNPHGSFCEREAHARMLDWDGGSMDKEKKSFTSQNKELTLYPFSSSSQVGDERQDLHNSITASELFAPSFLVNHPLYLSSLQCSSPTSFTGHNIGQYSLGAKDDIVGFLNDLILPVPNLLNPVEYSSNDTSSKGSSMFLSPQNYIWFMSKFLDEDLHHPSTDIDFDLGHKSLSVNHSLLTYHALEFPGSKEVRSNNLTKDKYENCVDGFSHGGIINNFQKDMVNIHYRSSIFLETSIDNEKGYPMLPYHQSCWYEGENYSDASEVKYF